MSKEATDFDAQLTKEDERAIGQIMRLRKRLSSSFDRKWLVSLMRDIVDESELIEFFNSRSRKFIDENKPPCKKMEFDIDKTTCDINDIKELGIN